MKKLFYIILFSLCICSCSKDDDMFNISIVGTWQDKVSGDVFVFGENEVKITDEYGEFYLEYVFTGKEITFIEYEYYDIGYEISYYHRKIKEIEKQLETARGKKKDELLDQLIAIKSLIREVYNNDKKEIWRCFSTINKFTSNELSFYFDNKECNLIRINN